MKVAFIGLGHMGAPMSRNILAAGHDLVVHDLRQEAAARLVDDGAAWAGSPHAAGAGREAVITMLPGPSSVEQVLLGTRGLLAGMSAGSVWIDMSTSTPAVADRVRAQADPRGIAVLDAAVSGMAAGARDGTLQIFAASSGRTVANVAASPPAKICRVPSRAPAAMPLTAASSTAIPR